MNAYDDLDIVLVEDNPYDADFTMRAFRTWGFAQNVLWLRDGVEAIEFLQCRGGYAGRNARHVPKLMLLDLKMPRLDGFEVLRALGRDEYLRTMPVVAMTSSNQVSDIAECYRLGVNGYVIKPLNYDDFAATMQRIGEYWLLTNAAPTDE